jgi:hypothetical protein
LNVSFDGCDELSANKGVPTTSVFLTWETLKVIVQDFQGELKKWPAAVQGRLARVLSGAEKKRYIHLVKYLTAV